MIWLIIIIFLYGVSEYLYRTSSFSSDKIAQNNLEYLKQLEADYDKQFQALLDRDSGTSLVTDRTAIFDVEPQSYNQFMSAEDKHKYLLSTEWQQLRTKVFTRDNYTCQSCGSKDLLNCHHITYKRLGAEKLKDLTTLCVECHTQLHKQLGYDRITEYPIKPINI